MSIKIGYPKGDKELFLRIFNYIAREGTDRLLKMFDRTDFWTAPASSYYHSANEGGLVEHLLNVFRSLMDTIGLKASLAGIPLFDIITRVKEGDKLLTAEENQGLDEREILDKAIELLFGKGIDFNSLVLVTLLHDCHKINYYEKYDKSVYKGVDEKNKKIYETETAYKSSEKALVFGDDGTNSNYIISSCIKLTYEEMLAIENHMGYTHNGQPLGSASKAWAKSPLALYLHLSDMESTFILESRG